MLVGFCQRCGDALDSICTSAFWLASRGAHRILTGAQIIELALTDAAAVFEAARRETALTLAQRPTDNARATALLVGAEALRRAGDMPPNWLAMCVEVVGTPWPERLPPAARMFVDQRWPAIQRVAAELLYSRFVMVSRALELCGINAREAA